MFLSNFFVLGFNDTHFENKDIDNYCLIIQSIHLRRHHHHHHHMCCFVSVFSVCEFLFVKLGKFSCIKFLCIILLVSLSSLVLMLECVCVLLKYKASSQGHPPTSMYMYNIIIQPLSRAALPKSLSSHMLLLLPVVASCCCCCRAITPINNLIIFPSFAFGRRTCTE
jgi:hypothetical protein